MEASINILISSAAYAPSVGGIERVSEIMVKGLAKLGHEVKIATKSKNDQCSDERIFRNPSAIEMLRLLIWADVHLQCNLMTSTFLTSLLLRKPTYLVHHTWLTRPDGSVSSLDVFKRRISALSTRQYAVSQTLASGMYGTCHTIENPFDNGVFFRSKEAKKSRHFLFVGRLVSDKALT